MKKIIVFLVLLLVGFQYISAQEIPGKSKQQKINQNNLPARTNAYFKLDRSKLKVISPGKTLKAAAVDAPGIPAADGWSSIMSENFESSFPGGLWEILTTGAAYWDDENYKYHGGSWGAWCAMGAVNPAGGAYVNNMNSWMIYGPFNLSDATEANLQFWFSNFSETGYDYFQCFASINGSEYWGWQWSGDQSTWQQYIFDLKDVYTLGNLCGQSNVWIAFRFVSDESECNYAGAFVDDILLQKYSGGCIPPAPPVLTSPDDTAFIAGTNISFSWEASAGASEYWIQVSRNDSFTDLLLDQSSGNNTNFSSGSFPDDKSQFWWRAAAKSNCGWGDYSASRTFFNGSSDPDINVTPSSLTINQSSAGLPSAALQNNIVVSEYERSLKIPPVDPDQIKEIIRDKNGKEIIKVIMPGKPPVGVRAPVAKVSSSAVTISGVPAYDWSFGCTATSASMLAAYYDRNGFPNIYTGPTNGGVMPLNNSSWGTVVISDETRSQCPLSASRNGLDGRTTRGHVDDYWIKYNNPGPDPFIVNGWTEHSYGECLGDYMRTNQSEFGSTDGSTWIYYYGDGSVFTPYNDGDGIYGMKLFFEARGYTVDEVYTQLIYGYNGNNQGFTFADYKEEIDAGKLVMLHVQGHTMLGYGYDNATNSIYLHDTWDYSDHSMPWGGSYAGMAAWGVSVIHISGGSSNLFTIQNTGLGVLVVSGITDNKNWLSTSPASPFILLRGESKPLYVNVDWNQVPGAQETGTITIGSTDPDEPSVQVTVTAVKSNPSVLVVTPSNRNVSSTAGTTSFSVSNSGGGTFNWNAVESSDWVSITNGNSGTNSGTINCSYTANTTCEARVCTLTISAAGAVGTPQYVTISQSGSGTPVLSVSPANREVTSAAGTTTFTVSNTGCGTLNWTASEQSDWVTITSGTSGTNSGTITCSYNANAAASARVCTLTVSASGASGSPAYVYISQAAGIVNTYSISISPASQSSPATVGTLIPVQIKIGDPAAIVSPDNFFGVSFNLNWDKSANIEFASNTAGPWLGNNPLQLVQSFSDHIEAGLSRTEQPGQTGSGVVLLCTLRVKQAPASNTTVNLTLTNITAAKSDGSPLNLASTGTSTITLNPCTAVWPGDADNNGTVTASDVLRLGLYYNKTGAPRSSAGCSWGTYPPGTPQQLCTPWDPVNAGYADCDGNGTVSAADVLCIGLNYGRTHTLAKESQSAALAKNERMTLRHKLLNANEKPISMKSIKNGDIVYLAQEIENGEELYGISYSAVWDNNSVEVIEEWSDNGMRAGETWGAQKISLGKTIAVDNRIDVAITRTDKKSTAVNSYETARIKVRVKDASALRFDFDEVTGTNAAGEYFAIKSVPMEKGVSKVGEVVSSEFKAGNYPNPFNPMTKIQINVPREGAINVIVYSSLGQEVTRIVANEYMSPGVYEYEWDGTTMPSGMYFIQLTGEGINITSKMLLIK